jgi:hypothetical protein
MPTSAVVGVQKTDVYIGHDTMPKNKVCYGWTCRAIMPGIRRHKIWLGSFGLMNQE